MTQNVSGLFDRYGDAENAVAELQTLGIDRMEISLLANNSDEWFDSRTGAANPDVSRADAGRSHVAEDTASGAGIGALAGGAAGVLAGLGLIAIPGVGPVVAAGWLASTVAGAAAGAVAGGAGGGIVGALTSSNVPEDEANVYAEGVRRGGTLVSARVPDAKVAAAQAILDKNGRVDYHLREQDYRASGWTRFDETAPAYTSREVSTERSRYM